MNRMNHNGFWSYFWSVLSGLCGALTFQHVFFVLGFLVSTLFAWLTFRSNDRKNKAAIEEDRRRTCILQKIYTHGNLADISRAEGVVANPKSRGE
ncbi:hypothetical protein EN46_01945 [Citrobacter amalonaticus]